ncbi:hypothetical protein, partial [Rhodobaculum claviforme]|uniref:hypothetical protein n=1 Tax=Rhodobaculum claviforme TaxID=1549854 RepID=UPI001A91AAC3
MARLSAGARMARGLLTRQRDDHGDTCAQDPQKSSCARRESRRIPAGSGPSPGLSRKKVIRISPPRAPPA